MPRNAGLFNGMFNDIKPILRDAPVQSYSFAQSGAFRLTLPDGQVLAGDDRLHARDPACGGGVDTEDAGVGELGAENLAVQHSRQVDVVRVDGLAGDLARAIHLRERLADHAEAILRPPYLGGFAPPMRRRQGSISPALDRLRRHGGPHPGWGPGWGRHRRRAALRTALPPFGRTRGRPWPSAGAPNLASTTGRLLSSSSPRLARRLR